MASKSISERILSINVPIITIILIVLVAIPLVNPFGLPFPVDAPVRASYEYILDLPDNSVVVFQCTSSLAQWGDVVVMTIALSQFMWSHPNDVKYIVYCTGVEAPLVMEEIVELSGSIPADHGKVYGEDWVLFDYIAGDEVAQASMASSFRGTYSTDYYGTPIDQLPIMQGIDNANDVDVYITQYGLSDGCDPGLRQWTYKYGTPTILLPMSSGLTYAAQYWPGVVIGYMGGGGHAAQLELLIGFPGEATKYNDAKNLMYFATDIFIILGTVIYWYHRSSGRTPPQIQRDRDYEG